MKVAFILGLIFALAGCAANQQTTLTNEQARVRAMHEGKHPELAGLTEEQIERLAWRMH